MEAVADAAVGIPNNDLNISVGTDCLSILDNVDLAKVDRSFPILKEGAYVVEIAKFETKENKSKNGHNLYVTLKLTAPALTVDGKTMNAGFPINDLISLVRTEKYNPLEKLADIQLAALGKQQSGFRFGDYIGRKVTIRLKIEEDEEYGTKNRVARYVKAATTPIASL